MDADASHDDRDRAAGVSDARARGLEAYRARSWEQAFARLVEADRSRRLGPGDLSSLAFAAYLSGRVDEAVATLERAQRDYAAEDDPVAATRACFWLGFWLAERGERAPASGWLGRAQRLLERAPNDAVESGYLMVPAIQGALGRDDTDAAFEIAGKAVRIGERFGDPELVALALHAQGRAP